MRRLPVPPRPDWQRTVESQGFLFHTGDGGAPYWDESAYYEFTRREVDALEQATYALNDMCLQAVDHVLDAGRLAEFQIPREFHDYVRASWERDELTVYARFDLAFDGGGPPKLLEYNADTPTSLLEAAVIQWYWLQDHRARAGAAGLDQFNSIHERLIEAWRALVNDPRRPPGPVHFTAIADSIEDVMTVTYLQDTAVQAGVDTRPIAVERVGWNWPRRRFVDEQEQPIGTVFKLYPWEWMLREAFAPRLLESAQTTRWLEPAWKMVLSNKAILPVLWELFPDSPFLLPAGWQPPAGGGAYVRKPILGREGANVAVVANGQTVVETGGAYGAPFVYQALQPLPRFDGNYAVVGSWMVNGHACGIGVREDPSPVTRNTSRFVPHAFVA